MNKKGFTLVELLAVLGLLAIIALMATPIMVNQISSQKKKNYENFLGDLCLSAEAYINHTDDIEGIDDFKEAGDTLSIKMEDLIANGYVKNNTKNPKTKETIKTTDVITVTMTTDKTYTCSMNGYVVSRYKEAILNGTDPVLKSDMIPVTIDDNGTVKIADTTKEWYKYENKKWANAVVLSNPTKYSNKGAGKTIAEADIKAYYVWIPRYSYKLFESTTPIEIQIKFEKNTTPKSTNTTTGKYYTHPAFTYGTDELNGFWVGKFETTGSGTAPTIKPNIASLRSQKVSTQYATSLLVSTNSRMMKNDEWGAVAYLSHSAYGVRTDIRINNNSGFITGCGASADDAASNSDCQIEYGKETSYPQSTTGNITGIFDISGGAWEYVMSVRADSDGNPLSGQKASANSGFNGNFGSPGEGEATSLTTGTDFPQTRDYNLYDNPTNRSSITVDNGCNGSKCYGYALGETSAWYSDNHDNVSTNTPWFGRGGRYSYGAGAGVFAFYYFSGNSSINVSFRTVATQ